MSINSILYKNIYGHRKQIEASDDVGCCYCIRIYAPSEIIEWCDDGQTAICPRCGVDAVLPGGADLCEGLLRELHAYAFTTVGDVVTRRRE